MRIKFTKVMAGPEGTFQPGDVISIDDEMAAKIIEAGAAVPLVAPKRTAVVKPTETRTDEQQTAEDAAGEVRDASDDSAEADEDQPTGQRTDKRSRRKKSSEG